MTPATPEEEDVQRWAPWQRAYRFGVILVIPPDPLRTQVDSLRARHDPRSHAICPAHISLTVPLPRSPSAGDWRELRAIAAQTEPLRITYGPLVNFPPHPGVCLAISPKGGLDHLRASLEGAAVFAGAAPRSHAFSAHMTIAEFIAAQEASALMAELADVAPRGEFTCDRLSYMVPGSEFRFTERRVLVLGAPSGGAGTA